MTLKTLRLCALAAALLFASSARADDAATTEGPWTFRLRATYLSMANKSDSFSALGLNFASNAVSVNSKLIPEFDFSYNFTQNLAAELVLTIPQTQDVSLQGVGGLGSFKHLPPVLAAQYHFLPGATVNPYVGVGINYTLIYGANLKVAGVPLALDTNSIGIAGQAGVDVLISKNLYLNVDLKKVTLSSGVYVGGGAKLTTAHLDPWLFSVGIGTHF
jgi:outer membrane protein